MSQRMRLLLGLLVGLVVVLVGVVVALAVSGGDDQQGGSRPTTTTRAPSVSSSTSVTTTLPVCQLPDVTTDPKSLPSAVGPSESVQLGAILFDTLPNGCDTISFSFDPSNLPEVRAAYKDTVPAGPSGEALEVAGSVFLVVRFAPASGSQESLAVDGTTFTQGHLRGARQVENFEGVVVWAIGLDTARPFTLVISESGTTALIEIA